MGSGGAASLHIDFCIMKGHLHKTPLGDVPSDSIEYERNQPPELHRPSLINFQLESHSK